MSPTPTEECKGAPGLKSCPFCGGDSAVLRGERGWRFWCLRPARDCGLIGPFKNTEAEAIAAWNRRPDPVRASVIEECAKVCEGWLVMHGPSAPEYVSARIWANDAVKDIRDAIRALAPVGSAPLADTGGSMPSNSSSDPLRAELLAALKEMYDQMWHLAKDKGSNPWLKQARAAIAKAEEV